MPKDDTKDNNKKKTKKVQPEDRRNPLDSQKKQQMLAVLIRNPDAFDAVSELLTVDQVNRWSPSMALVWREVKKFYDGFAELPDRGQLYAQLSDELGGNVDLLAKEEQEEIDKFLEYAWDDTEHGKKIKSPKQLKFAVATCKQFLEENVAHDVHKAVYREGTLPADIPKLLEETRLKLDQVQSLTEVELDVPFPDNWDKRTDQQLFTTGCEPLDKFMGGGWRAGEVILFMGPYGSCKTALVCHSVSNQLRYCSKLVAEGKARKNDDGEQMIPVVVLIFTESDKDEYRNRLMSNLAQVPWTRIAQMESVADLEGGNKPGAVAETEYEIAEFENDIKNDKPFLSERKRVERARVLANKHLMILDCTDAEDNPHQIGRGGVPEIANIVRGIFRKKKATHYPICFWLDHVSGLIDRMAEVIADEKIIHRTLSNIPRIAADKLGKPFKAPVGLMHQFAGKEQNRSAAATYHHADAEGSKAIGKYAPFVFTSGKVDSNGYCRWECTKHRRTPPSSTRIVQLLGQFNRLIDRSDTHGVAPGLRVIMSKKEMGSVGSLNQDGGPPGIKKAGGKYGNITDM